MVTKRTTNSKNVAFQDWRWDFLSALFEQETCNCVCGTLYLLSAAEYVGLFPSRVRAMASSNHIWVSATRDDGSVEFVETTLRPGHARWHLSPAKARPFRIYGYGAWYSYTEADHVVQEAFINQIITSASNKERLTPILWRMLDTWDRANGARTKRRIGSSNSGSGTSGMRDWVLDLVQLRLRQLTWRRAPFADQARAAAALAAAMQRVLDSRHSVGSESHESACSPGPECFLRSFTTLCRWLVWTRLVHLRTRTHMSERAQQHIVAVERFVWKQARSLHARRIGSVRTPGVPRESSDRYWADDGNKKSWRATCRLLSTLASTSGVK